MSWYDRNIRVPNPYLPQPQSIGIGKNNSTIYSQSRVTQKWQQLRAKNCLTHSNYLSTYRKNKVNENYMFGVKQNKRYLPEVLCNIFGIGQQNQQRKVESNGRNGCECNKTEDKLCQLLMRWIEQEYYWKTDKQFHKIYDNYQSRKTQQSEYLIIKNKLSSALSILGIEMEISTVMEILTNYVKHAEYYNKIYNLVDCSDIYVWVGLGVCYHADFNAIVNSKLHRSIAFWGLDIAMEIFGDLQPATLIKIQQKAMRHFQFYFSKWLQLLSTKNINFRQLINEWINQLMFGYMGIQSIAFFVDCFRKSGWNYLIKIMLSYFQSRTKQISKNLNFLNGNIDTEQLTTLIVNSKEEWPMIFCNASSFSIKQ